MKYFYLFLLFFSLNLLAQKTITGRIVSEKNQPLVGASIYFNNTTVGTITDDNGYFKLSINDGKYSLVVSFLGFETITLPFDTKSTTIPSVFTMKAKAEILDEVVITKTVYDEDWQYNLKRFEDAFLGKTKLAATCKILNPKDLHFEFNRKTNTLTAFARKTLKIKHQGLGYIIEYDLVDFVLEPRKKFFSGYARYKNLRKSVSNKKIKNRLEAYNGSRMHFLRSLLATNLTENGFVVNQFRRLLNPDRPTELEIKKARQLLVLARSQINFTKEITNPKTALDSALVTLKKSKLPKYQDFLYKTNIPYDTMITYEEEIPFLDFVDYLSIIYKNEAEEYNYLIGRFGKVKKATGVQTSNIVLLDGKSKIDPSGILKSGSFLNEGYWAFESFGDMLPLDYKPL